MSKQANTAAAAKVAGLQGLIAGFENDEAKDAFITELVRAQAALILSQAMASTKGMNQQKLAKKLGCTHARVSQVLNGNANVSLDTLARFAHALGKTVKLVLE